MATSTQPPVTRLIQSLRLMPLILLTVMLGACTDPFIVIPGGSLTGDVAATPDSWATVPETVQLETRPDHPYSVNIWAVADEGNLYVATRKAKWISFIVADARVKLRIDGNVYELLAEEVQDARELGQVAMAYSKKYDIDPMDNWVAEGGRVFRLSAR